MTVSVVSLPSEDATSGPCVSPGSVPAGASTVRISSFVVSSVVLQEIAIVKVASTEVYPSAGVATVKLNWSGDPVPGSLQSLVGWTFAAGIVPVHVVVCEPGVVETVTLGDLLPKAFELQ